MIDDDDRDRYRDRLWGDHLWMPDEAEKPSSGDPSNSGRSWVGVAIIVAAFLVGVAFGKAL